MKHILTLTWLIFMSCICFADICTSTGSGNWNSSSTWSCGHVPGSNDTVIVAAGHVVTVNCNCGEYSNTRVEVYGQLHFNNGRKLSFDINSVIQVYAGGLISGDNPGAKIIIAGVTKWDGSDPTVIGPAFINNAYTGPATGILPVELINFAAISNQAGVELIWSTASEIYSDYFIIERTIDLTNWEIIGKINAAGSSVTRIDYSLLDDNALQGISYYRLLQYDMDGKSHVYRYIEVEHKKYVDEANVFPNPATDHINIQGLQGSMMHIEILNLQGVPCASFNRKCNKTTQIDVSTLKAGQYILKAQSATSTHTEKIVVK